MKIIADSNIPYLPDAFQEIASVQTLSASEITSEAVKDADLLFTRSTVKVDQTLLEGSRVRFVATSTIGVDHVDLAYLAKKNIVFASAPGSNSNSVAEWFVNALLTLARRLNFAVTGKTIGIVGVGNVGSKIEKNARALGAKVLLCDPPLKRKSNDPKYRPFSEILEQSDILTLHVPLQKHGPDATYHLINEATIAKMKPDSILINASRGAVVSENALQNALQKRILRATILDVFESEPAVNPEILKLVSIATPHIAGHSLHGKVNGTEIVYRAACRFLSIEPTWKPIHSLPPTPVPTLTFAQPEKSDEDLILEAMQALYSIEVDDTFLRQIAALSDKERASRFSQYRRNYRIRHEAKYTTIKVPAKRNSLANSLSSIGFSLAEDDL